MASKEHTEEAKITTAWVALGGMFGPVGLIIAGLSAVIGKAILKEEEDNTVESPEEAWERRRKWLDEFEGRQAAYDAAIRNWLENGRMDPKPVPPEMSAMDKWRLAYYRAERAKRWAKQTAADAKEGWRNVREDWRAFWSWFWDQYDRGVHQAERDRQNGEPWWFVQTRPGPTINRNIFDDEPVDAEYVDEPMAAEYVDEPVDAEVVDEMSPVRQDTAPQEPEPAPQPNPPPPPRLTEADPDDEQHRASERPHFDPYHSDWSGIRPDWTVANENTKPRPGGAEPEPEQYRPPIRVPSTTPDPNDNEGDHDMTTIAKTSGPQQLAPSGSGRGVALRPTAGAAPRAAGGVRTVTGTTGVGVQANALSNVQHHQAQLNEVLSVAAQMATILRETAAAAAEAAIANAASTGTDQANEAITAAYDAMLSHLLQLQEDATRLQDFFRKGEDANFEEQAVLAQIRQMGADGRYFSSQIPQQGI